MNPIEPTTPISITLQAHEWNQVMFHLGAKPYNEVAHLIEPMKQQAQTAAAQVQPLSNGADAHVPD